MKLQSVSCRVFQIGVCNQRERAPRHEHTESSLVVTGYRTCEERETTLHMEGRCFVAAAVHARRVVALYSYAAISRAIGRTRGQNDEPTIVQFRRALPERYFPADAKSMYSQRSGTGGCSDLRVELAAAHGIKLRVSELERQTVIDPIPALFVCVLPDGPP